MVHNAPVQKVRGSNNIALALTFGVRSPIAIMVLMAVLLVAIEASIGTTTLNFPVKLAVALGVAVAGGTLILYRPALFPMAGFLFAVPFDNLLQTGGGTITKYLAVLSAGVALLLMTDRRRVVAPSVGILLWVAFLVWNVATLMWSAMPGYRSEFLIAMVQLFALYAIFSALQLTGREVRFLLGAAVAGGCALSVAGLWMYTHGSGFASAASASRVALQLTLGKQAEIDPNHFAAALVLPIGLTLVAALHNTGWRKAVYAALLCLLACGVFISGSRGTLTTIGVMVVFLAIFYGHRRQLFALIGLALACSLPFPSIWARFTDPSQAEAGGRFPIWAIGFDAFKHHWLGGIGTQQFQIGYTESYLRAARGLLIHPWSEDPHNIIISTGVELGVIGLALLLAAWYFQVRIASNVPPSSSLFHVRMAVEAATVGLFINAMTVDMMFYKYLWIAFIAGAMVRGAGMLERRPQTAAATVEVVPPFTAVATPARHFTHA